MIFLLTLASAAAAEPKRVLIVHSFGSVAPPFTTHSVAFETELVEKLNEHVDLDEVSLDNARYAEPEMHEALVQYLQTRQAKWHPDLVVPIGSPAGVFVAQYRDRLFADIPILYCGMDQRRLPPGTLQKNAAFVGENFDVPAFVEDILQVAPGTKNIAVVIGASPLEQYWAEAFRKEWAPFIDRVNFIWLNDLSLDQMLERTRTLPPNSYIFLTLLLRDAAGVTHNADEVLQKIHAVANAPINGIFQQQLGLGIVGGRLYQAEREGRDAADLAIRILRGEPASSLPPQIVGPLPPRYDWRELQRWKIDQKLLPVGSTILFRQPTMWQRHTGWIVAGISLGVIQALLIAGLLANLFRRRRAEGSLRESEERFRKMSDAAPVLIWMAGPDKQCTFFNKAWLDFTGRSMTQELGEGWSEGVYADDYGECLKTYVSAFEARKPFSMQYRLRHHDGAYRWITDRGVPRYGRGGEFRGYVGACVDITDLLSKEEALHEFEERVALAADAAHLGVWELDTTTDKIWMSDHALRIFQFDPETPVTYLMFQERVHAEDRARHDSSVRRAIETQGGYELEYRILLPDQTVRWLTGRGRYVNNPETKRGKLVGVSIDVTERKQAEQLFQLAAEVSHLGVWDWDETTGKLLWDRAMRETFGVPPEGEVTLDTFYGALYPPDLERVKQVWRQAIESGRPYQIEFRVQRPNGAIGWIDARGWAYYDDKGNPLRMIGVVFDITDRKEAEEEAHARRDQIDLLTRVSLLGEMTASLAHELNQPLSAIVSNANAGTRFIDKGHVDLGAIREILVDVVADGHRATEIIRGVRNTMKKGGAIREQIDLNETVTKVAHLVQPDATVHSCELKMSLAEYLPLIDGDPIQIQQVLVNLIGNAFDSMRETPPKSRVVEIQTEHDGDGSICVSVQDRGDGIPDAVRERLFEQFFTTKEDGLGMGLAIVRSTIEAHGGKIGVDNVDGGGARFHFSLPTSKNSPP